jgi:hypothetical protein
MPDTPLGPGQGLPLAHVEERHLAKHPRPAFSSLVCMRPEAGKYYIGKSVNGIFFSQWPCNIWAPAGSFHIYVCFWRQGPCA